MEIAIPKTMCPLIRAYLRRYLPPRDLVFPRIAPRGDATGNSKLTNAIVSSIEKKK